MSLTERFIQERQFLNNVSPKTLAWYRGSFKAFAPVLDQEFSSTAILKADLVAHIGELRKTNQAVSINTYLRCLNAFFAWAHAEGLMEKFRMPRLKEESKVVECLKPEHVKRILSAHPKTFHDWRNHALFLSLLDTGMRINEAIGLRREDVDFDNMLIKLQGKGNKQRLVPMSLELRRVLFKYLGKHEHAFVFPGPHGHRLIYRNVLKMFHVRGTRLGITGVRFSPHTFRHSFAIGYLRRGGSVFHLQKILGHTTLEMTRRYCNLMTEDLQAVHSKLSLLSV